MPTFTIDSRLEEAISETLAAAAGIIAIGATVVIGYDATNVHQIADAGTVAVHCSGHSNGVLGMHKVQIADPAFITIGVFTRTGQDLTGTAVQALAAAVDDVMSDSAIVTTLNAAATGLNVYARGVHLMDRDRDDGSAYRYISLQYEIKATVTS